MPRPLSLLTVFGTGRVPTEAEVRARLEPFAAFDPLGSTSGPRGWTQAWRGPDGDGTALRLAPREAGGLPGAFFACDVPPGLREVADAAGWTLDSWVELDAHDPLAAFGRQLRTCLLACPEPAALLDVPAQHVLAPDHLRAVASWTAAPPATELYRIHAVHPERGGREWWVHTHGLQRIGLPDLELLRVPMDLVETGAELIRAFVRGHVGDEVPARGRCDHLVRGDRLEWVPVQEAIPALRDDDLGGARDRGGAGSHRGRRAAFAQPGLPRSRWRPPLALLREWRERPTVFGLPVLEAERAAALARERWPVFERLFAAHGREPRWRFHASLGCPVPGGGTEHLWWLVRALEPRRLLARLETAPAAPVPLAPGDEAWHDLSRVTDWSVEGPRGATGPDTVFPPE